jgi:DNA replication and repair protein RecF
MLLHRLNLTNYRNYEAVNLEFTSKINVLVGINGSGKTNLLDAIYYLSFTRSSLQNADALNIRHGQDYFAIQGTFILGDDSNSIAARFQHGARKSFLENGAEYKKLSDHIGKYPVVLIAPDDVDLIRDGSESRRKFFDSLISQIDRVYLENLIAYNQVLKQRNGLLRMFHQSSKKDSVAIESFDYMLAGPGRTIYEKRKLFMDRFLPVFDRFYQFLVENRETASVTYSSGLEEMTMEEGCLRSRERDLILQRTNFGIHRDDYRFLLGQVDMKRFGSQGQQKSLSIALRLAQWALIRESKGFEPVLLLDDIFDKLDDFRIDRLLELIKSEFGQLFITDARPDRTSGLLKSIDANASIFGVEHGNVDRIQ